MVDDLRAWTSRHPWWVCGTFFFCLFMTLLYLPYDFLAKPLFRDVAEAQEVWFGFMLRGWAAKATEPLHWLIYGALAWGLWKERTWAMIGAALYMAQVAIGMLVWNLLPGGWGVASGVVSAIPFGLLAVALWRARVGFAPAPAGAP